MNGCQLSKTSQLKWKNEVEMVDCPFKKLMRRWSNRAPAIKMENDESIAGRHKEPQSKHTNSES